MTLNEMAYDILLEARNNQIAESEKLNLKLIYLWILTYRVLLIKQEMEKAKAEAEEDEDYYLDEEFYQNLRLHLDRVSEDPGHTEYVGDLELPTMPGANLAKCLIYVKDAYGNLIQLGNETKMKLQKYRKYTCKDYIAYLKNGKLYVEGDSNLIEFVDVYMIADDPLDESLCYDPDTDRYPLPEYMWPALKLLIMLLDFTLMRSLQSDTTNDSKDDTLNTYNPNLYPYRPNSQYAL